MKLYKTKVNIHKYSCIRTKLCPFTYIFSVAAFALHREIVTETTWPTQPTILTLWPFREKVANHPPSGIDCKVGNKTSEMF